jgi:hypothetical protein
MNRLFACSASVAVALALGCAGPEVRYDYDASANFAGLRTYDWYAAPARPGIKNPFMDARVRQAVEAELASRHLQKEMSADPDFLVTYYPVYRLQGGHRGSVGFGMGFGGFRGPGVGVGVAGPVESGPRGMLGSIVLEIQDFKTHRLVWKAEAVDALDDSATPEDANQDVASAVKKMLLRFPPNVSAR